MRLRTRGAWWNVFVLVLGFVCCNNFFKGWMSGTHLSTGRREFRCDIQRSSLCEDCVCLSVM